MSNKETVQQGLDARKALKEAERETEKVRKDLEDAGHELVSLRISHETERNAWKREKAELMDLLVSECDKNHKLEDNIVRLAKREHEHERRGLLANALKTVIGLVLVVIFRDLSLINFWLAAALTAVCTAYLAVAVVRLARSLKN